METWARSAKYSDSVNFVCICVLGNESQGKMLSSQMHVESGSFNSAVNGYVANKFDMPTYGQLGCQGFILLDKNFEAYKLSTSAFMEIQGLAFKQVETFLDTLIANQTLSKLALSKLPKVAPGEFCKVSGLAKAAQYNGSSGICVGEENERFVIQLIDGVGKNKVLKIKSENILNPSNNYTPPGGSSGGCGDCGCDDEKKAKCEDKNSCSPKNNTGACDTTSS